MFLSKAYEADTCYPAREDIFNAFSYFGPKDTKVVIVAQDPYHGPGQAHGLAFSVKPGVAAPPSLQNIFKEIKRDIPGTKHDTGCLESWAKQGVLLLNSVMSVRRESAGSHAGQGWEQATDRIIQELQQINPKVVYMLWGNFARTKKPLISKSLAILESTHPSPLSAHAGFIGCGHFSKANQILQDAGLEKIDWST